MGESGRQTTRKRTIKEGRLRGEGRRVASGDRKPESTIPSPSRFESLAPESLTFAIQASGSPWCAAARMSSTHLSTDMRPASLPPGPEEGPPPACAASAPPLAGAAGAGSDLGAGAEEAEAEGRLPPKTALPPSSAPVGPAARGKQRKERERKRGGGEEATSGGGSLARGGRQAGLLRAAREIRASREALPRGARSESKKRRGERGEKGEEAKRDLGRRA